MELNLLDLHELLDTFKVKVYNDYNKVEILSNCLELFEKFIIGNKINLSRIASYNNSVILYSEPNTHNIYFLHTEEKLLTPEGLISVGGLGRYSISIYSSYIVNLLKDQEELSWIPDIFSRIRKELREIKSND